MSETIFIKGRGGYDIPAVLTKPMDEMIHSCVVMLHGTCSNKNEVYDAYVYLANYLSNNGYASLRLDFIGSGESQVDMVEYSLENACNDACDAMNYLKDLGYQDISLLGWSQGAYIALLACDDSLSSVITLSCPLNLKSLFDDKMYEEALKNGYAMYDPQFREPVKFSLKWMNEVLACDVLDVFSKKNLPLLAIHGLYDDVVDPKCSKIIIDKSNHAKSKVVYFDECDHIYNVLKNDYDYFVKVCEEIINWLRQLS